MKFARRFICALSLCVALAHAQATLTVQNATGMRLLVADENTQPTVRIVLPGHPDSDRAITVIFPEHVSGKRPGAADVEQLYLFRPGRIGDSPIWQRIGHSLQYERDLKGVHFVARATLEDDGVRFHYEFTNRSQTAYEMIYAVTDPRLTSIFHDVRLERTYVHHKEGFDLLASETPSRLTMPLNQWLPARYLVSFTWPVPAQRVEHRIDGITYYNKSRAVDQPLVATVSADGKWVVASFSRQVGNVWSNPELTCQHVDPQASLPLGQQATTEVKILVLEGSLNQVLQKVVGQRNDLK